MGWQAFFEEVRCTPKFTEAAAKDATRCAHLNAVEYSFECLSTLSDADAIETMDKLQAAINRRDWPVRQRFLEIARLLTDYRDCGRSVH